MIPRAARSIDQTVDLWSIGCVYSEFAVWVTHGLHRLNVYRDLRKSQTSEIKGLADIRCFHNMERVLLSVEGTHRELVDYLDNNRADTLTQSVIEDMVSPMLSESPVDRTSALHMFITSQNLLEPVRPESPESKHIMQRRMSNETRSATLEFQKKMWNELQQDRLPQEFHNRKASFWCLGRVFASLHFKDDLDSYPESDVVFSSVYEMIVVEVLSGYCLCVRIRRYSDKGCSDLSTERMRQHMMICMEGHSPRRRTTERYDPLVDSIQVVPDAPGRSLRPMSRIDLGRVISVKKNTKAASIGIVAKESLPVLLEQSVRHRDGSSWF
jgi:hypothetical protein